ncbi:hypothetical protein KCG43_18540 [Photobacterium sp. WH24]|nr:hypothetical protein [Photobacterium sp. WH24]
MKYRDCVSWVRGKRTGSVQAFVQALMGALLPLKMNGKAQKERNSEGRNLIDAALDFRFLVAVFTKVDGFTGQSLPDGTFNPH